MVSFTDSPAEDLITLASLQTKKRSMKRRLIILTDGHTNPHTAKTASSVIRYRPDEVIALLDRSQAGKTTQELLNVGGSLPIVDSLDAAPDANTLLIGIAPPGGTIPPTWRSIILDAISRGMHVMSGLHEFIGDDEEFASAAQTANVQITDVRKNSFTGIARKLGLDESCLRIHTVGHDCSVGKMVTSIEITQALQERGTDAKFVATGQTGIMVEGEGLPIDCVVADFISGAAERLVLDNQHHEVILVEGQGSLVHPSYSGVTLGLLHGCQPHGMILCYEIGREVVTGVEQVAIPPLSSILELYETMASVMQPSRVIGISMNSRRVSEAEANDERKRLQDEFELPVCDVFRHGPEDLANAVIQLQKERQS